MRIVIAAALIALAGAAHAQSFNYTQYGSDGSISQGFYNQTSPNSWVGTEYTSQPTRTYEMRPPGYWADQSTASGRQLREAVCQFGGC